ncbi:MAG: type II toxin-antitoxin system RelE/ParE family toxin [Steroidobacteraceae bacterium]
MIRSFRHRGLEAFFTRDDSRKVPADRLARITRLLDRLEVSRMLQDMNLPGFDFHRLKGNRKGIYAVSVSGNWRLTFRFEGEHASDVDLEDYH